MPDKLLTRTASASIQGYLYQFDRTLIEILTTKGTNVVTIEGVEDIDIESGDSLEAVQCKYLGAKKFSLATIREAIIPMLKSSLDNDSLIYRLYIFCGKGGGVLNVLTLDELKSCLTLTKRNGEVVRYYDGISDDDLESFIKRLVIVEGEEFYTNRARVHELIRAELKCTVDDSNELYYSKALSIIYDRAISKDIDQRKITKSDLIKEMDTKSALYTRWHKEIIGVEKYLSMLRRRARANDFFSAVKSRYLIIEHADIFTEDDYVTIISFLARKQYGEGYLATAKPWTVVMDCDQSLLDVVKERLLSEGIAYSDGYEKIKFNARLFDKWPVINTLGQSAKIRIASYEVRLVSGDSYRGAVPELSLPDRVIAITGGDLDEYRWSSVPQMLQVTDVSMEQIKELLGV